MCCSSLDERWDIVGIGEITPSATIVHGYYLTDGWVSVAVKALYDELECWDEYPTLSEEIQVGSYSAWPLNQMTRMDVSGK